MSQTEKKKSRGGKKKIAPSFKTYIYKVLKQVHPEKSISADAIGQIDEYIKVLAMRLSESARRSCLRVGKSTVGAAEISLASNLYISGELAKHAYSQSIKACAKFQSGKKKDSSPAKGKKKSKSTPDVKTSSVRREVQAGLQFSVALAEKYIREFGASGLNVSKNASVALAAILEYITTEIIELSGNVTGDQKKVTILIRHVFLAVESDEELVTLTKTLGIEFVGCGVVPFVHESLKPTKEKRAEQAARRRKNRGAKGKDGVKKTRKFLPGTKALAEINRRQRVTDTLLQKLPFDRDVRDIATNLNESRKLDLKGVHFGSGAVLVLQRFVEARVARLCAASVKMAVHGKRDGVNESDVLLAWEMTESQFPIGEESVTRIGKNGIERLAFQGGVKRKTKEMYEVLMRFIHSVLSTVLLQTLLIIRHQDVITVGIKHLRDAFRGMGINFTIPASMGKPRVKKN